MIYSIGKFSKEIGISQKTLRTWHKSGYLVPFKVTEGGTRYYSEDQIIDYSGTKYFKLEKELVKNESL